MKRVFKTVIIFFVLLNSVYAVDLSDIMKQMGSDFRSITKAALTSNNSPESRAIALRLVESVELALQALPPAIDPSNLEKVTLYKLIMNELLNEAIQLNKTFETEPLNKARALDILKKMGNIRKKGHDIFR